MLKTLVKYVVHQKLTVIFLNILVGNLVNEGRWHRRNGTKRFLVKFHCSEADIKTTDHFCGTEISNKIF